MPAGHVVIVCGSRGWSASGPILAALSALPSGAVVIHGGAQGADQLAGSIACSLGLRVQVMPAQWQRFGRGAGPVRNAAMLRRLLVAQSLGWSVQVLAFVPSLQGTAGTAHMVSIARAAGVPVHVFGPTGRISGWGQAGTCGR